MVYFYNNGWRHNVFIDNVFIDKTCIVYIQSKLTDNLPLDCGTKWRMKEERMSYSHQDWVRPGWRCASSSPPPLSLPETRWSPGSLPPIRPTGETEQKHLRSSPSDMGSPLYRLSKADRDGTITKDKARCEEWGEEFWTEASFSTSAKVLFKMIFWCCLKSRQEMKTIFIHNFQCFRPQQTLCTLESLHGSATVKKKK